MASFGLYHKRVTARAEFRIQEVSDRRQRSCCKSFAGETGECPIAGQNRGQFSDIGLSNTQKSFTSKQNPIYPISYPLVKVHEAVASLGYNGDSSKCMLTMNQLEECTAPSRHGTRMSQGCLTERSIASVVRGDKDTGTDQALSKTMAPRVW